MKQIQSRVQMFLFHVFFLLLKFLPAMILASRPLLEFNVNPAGRLHVLPIRSSCIRHWGPRSTGDKLRTLSRARFSLQLILTCGRQRGSARVNRERYRESFEAMPSPGCMLHAPSVSVLLTKLKSNHGGKENKEGGCDFGAFDF